MSAFRYCVVLIVIGLVTTGAFWIRHAQAATFVVNSNGDVSDASPGNGVCATSTGVCTLRAAIQEANATAGTTDIITFGLGSGIPFISAGLELPHITSPVVIDGATGGATFIVINGNNAGAGASGLVLDPGSSGSQIKFLEILTFANYGIVIRTNGNTIQSCIVDGNGLDGLIIFGGANNLIGGTTASARNFFFGNGGSGVTIFGSTASGNQVKGNHIGVISGGGSDGGNATNGVRIDGAPNNTIGGLEAGARNVISGNGNYGLLIIGIGASGNQVQGNFIGTNAAGTAALRNDFAGVVLQAPGNTVGGTSPEARNLISGNRGPGVWLSGASASGNQVQGNFIGTNAAGMDKLGNSGDASVIIGNAPNNIIGGTATDARNIISGNVGHGVLISGSSATGNKVQGNYIGTNSAGTAVLGNAGNGVILYDGPTNNTVGGDDDDDGAADGVVRARNVISGNQREGVFFSITGSAGNLLQGNFIGTDAAGTAALGNAQNGVKILAAPNITVGGLAAGAGNVISGNGNDGVLVDGNGANGIKVQGNYIGTNAAGLVALGNGAAGVGLFTANNMVGGTTLQARNVISGNGREGVYITAIGNYVQGNFIGTNALGTAALGNALDGVLLDGAGSTFIGGTSVGARNVISSNKADGVRISGAAASSNILEGNFIGTDVSGTVALPNNFHGVRISDSSNNIVGGSGAGAGNLISGNSACGVFITSLLGTSNNNWVQGNLIGTNASGTSSLGNKSPGVLIQSNAMNNLVGGTEAGARNVISGNNSEGISIVSATSNQVVGNFIGTNAAGTGALGNTLDGVLFFGGSNNRIGAAAGQGNLIAFNGGRGVNLQSGSAGNAILGNSIYSNSNIGIDLNSDGVTPNDAGDADTGPNNLQNYPVITSAVNNPSTNTTTVQGTLTSTPNTTFTIEFFSSAAQDPSGFGEGQTFRGSISVTANASGNANFAVTLSAATPAGHFITATATDPSNNTSEFSQALQVFTPTPSGPTIFVEQGTNLLAAVDSVTFVRGPFTPTDNYNFSSDHRTRLIFFTTNLGFTQPTQPDIGTLSVEVGGFSLPVESVGPSSFAGVDASYIVFRLPDLPVGDWPLSIRLRGVLSINSPTLSIRAGP